MKTKWLKVVLPVSVLVLSTSAFMAVNTFAKKEVEDTRVSTVPTVSIERANADDIQVLITAHGAVEPIEITPLAAQVAGEVTFWHANFLEGGRISRGELLFSIEKDAYEAALLQAQASLISAEANLVEQKALADVAADEARRNPQKKYTDLFLRKPQVLSAEAQVKSAQASLKIAQRDLDNCDVYAPFDALIAERSIGTGQYLNVGTEVATLYNIERAKVVVPLPGFDSAFLPDDLTGVAVSVAPQSGLGAARGGKIVHDLGIIDDATRMTHLMIEVTEPYNTARVSSPLKFGSYVQVSFSGKTLHDVYRIPEALVNNRIVWVVNDDSKLEPRTVTVVREEGGYFIVRDGLTADDRVVITPPEYPLKGMAVKVANPEAPRESSSDTDTELDQLSATH